MQRMRTWLYVTIWPRWLTSFKLCAHSKAELPEEESSKEGRACLGVRCFLELSVYGTTALLWVRVPSQGETIDQDSLPLLAPEPSFPGSSLNPRQVEQMGGGHEVTSPHDLLTSPLLSFPFVSHVVLSPQGMGNPSPPSHLLESWAQPHG